MLLMLERRHSVICNSIAERFRWAEPPARIASPADPFNGAPLPFVARGCKAPEVTEEELRRQSAGRLCGTPACWTASTESRRLTTRASLNFLAGADKFSASDPNWAPGHASVCLAGPAAPL